MTRRSTAARRLACAVLLLIGVAVPGTAVAGAPQRYLNRPDDWFAGDEAKRIAANILSYQADEGGWPKNTDTTAAPFRGDRKSLQPTFDNDATTDELRYLARIYKATKDDTYRTAAEKGVDYILKAQYPTGGWPQHYPPPTSYHRHITFNDNAMVRLMQFLRETYTSDLYAFVGTDRRQIARKAFDHGVECILKCQIKVDGKLTGWCAQHDEKDYSPRIGRTYELVSISGSESVGIVRLLMSLDKPSPEVVRAVDAAVAWFEAAKLKGIRVVTQPDANSPTGRNRVVVKDPAAPPMWARFYEIGTNRPIYSDRDGVAKRELADIGYERRNGYAWLGTWPQRLLEVEYPAWKRTVTGSGTRQSSGAKADRNSGEFRYRTTAASEPAIKLDVRAIDRDRVLKAAEAYLKEAPVTVTAAHSPRSTGGVHDFFSEGDYWWPDPANPGGPYIQKDGMTNPGNFNEHRRAMVRMSIHVPTLTAAYRLTGDEKYARHAIKHLRAWFIDEATKMNPNLQYAQAIFGRFTGRGIGIIDSIHLIEPARSAQILEQAGVLKGEELAGIKKWFTDYLTWLKTSKNSQDEMNAKNNHGTCWVMQVAAFAAFAGDKEALDLCRKRFKEILLPSQLAADGSFPEELRRTKPYCYTLFNLDAMCTIAMILSTPEDNLWAFTTPSGRNLRKSVEYAAPYIKDKSKWPKPPDVMYWEFWPVRSPALAFAGVAYGEQAWVDLWKTLPADFTNEEVIRNVPIRTPILWFDPA